ncbi:MAG: hypothetical protein CL885_01670 [Dehalococcoidia bacterium]|nr:hypothetical protein [Dehalococcoidia bacterium]HCH36208.1 hypothetical protein [Dehalococcoidia bacterium]
MLFLFKNHFIAIPAAISATHAGRTFEGAKPNSKMVSFDHRLAPVMQHETNDTEAYAISTITVRMINNWVILAKVTRTQTLLNKSYIVQNLDISNCTRH